MVICVRALEVQPRALGSNYAASAGLKARQAKCEQERSSPTNQFNKRDFVTLLHWRAWRGESVINRKAR
jgi:hypothetical protein